MKNKNPAYIIIILTFALLLFLTSCRRSINNISTEIELDNGETGILAGNNAVDFYFYYPENWAIQRDDAMITISVSDGDRLETNINDPVSGEVLAIPLKPNIIATVFGLPDGQYKTAGEYWDNYAVLLLEGTFPGFEIESAGNLTVDGADAKKYTYTATLLDMKYKVSQIIFFKNRQVYTLQYTSTENKYDTYEKVLDTVAETFKFK